MSVPSQPSVCLNCCQPLTYLCWFSCCQFENLSAEVVSLSQEKVLRVFDVLESLSVTMTSFAKQRAAANANQPPGFWTLPDVMHHFGVARANSEAFLLTYTPLVSEANRETWEVYSAEHERWILGANEASNSDDFQNIPDQIWRNPEKDRRLAVKTCGASSRRLNEDEDSYVVEPEGSGPYAPVWLLSPPPAVNDTSIINYNMFDKPVFEKAVSFIEQTRKPTFLDVCTQTAWFGAEDPSEGDSVQTVVVYPVFLGFDSSTPIVGHLSAILPWDLFFENLINDEASVMHVVLSNTCDETFSYEVRGHDATFLGEYDVHDPAYDSHKVSAIFADFANPDGDQFGDHCVYTISVYPTRTMEESFESNKPMIYVVVVLAIFVLSVAVFAIYDALVSRRQEVVMDSANKNQKIVSTLFPKAVHERIMDNLAADSNTDTVSNTPAHLTSEPIADNFPETTIMFADIVGFTAWSSSREPTQVFSLLEQLYYEFDMIAKRRRVFKVETSKYMEVGSFCSNKGKP